MGHPADDLRSEVLGEGAATFGDFDSYRRNRGGNAELARALAGELGGTDPSVLARAAAALGRGSWGHGVGPTPASSTADAAVIAVPDPPRSMTSASSRRAPGADRRGTRIGALRAEREALRRASGLRARRAPSCRCAAAIGPTPSSIRSGEPAPFVTAYAGTIGAVEALVDSPGAGGMDRGARRPPAQSWSWIRKRPSSRPGTTIPGFAAPTPPRAFPLPSAPRSSRRPFGPLYFAGEHTAGDWHGLMEGAFRSGKRAARQLLEAGFR